jgi:hypothetical protein
MQIDIAATPVRCREMEDQVDAFDRTASLGLLVEISFDELDCAAVDVTLDVGQPTAAQVIDDTDLRATPEE